MAPEHQVNPCIVLRMALARHGHTGRSAAREMGVNETLVSRWMSGSRLPTREQAIKIEEVLHVHPSIWRKR